MPTKSKFIVLKEQYIYYLKIDRQSISDTR